MSNFLNCTGDELSSDMACVNTVEAFVIEKEDDSFDFFYDDTNDFDMPERINRISEFINKHKNEIDGIIILNNSLGKLLFDKLHNKYKFLASVKRPSPNDNLHWFYTEIKDFDHYWFVNETKE